MGEYAKYNGEEIKIGTCESMYYLRADQAHLVTAMSGNVDPVRDRESIRFRFPFPDEDGKAPGDFEDYDRGVRVDGPLVAEILRRFDPASHDRIQFVASQHGYNVCLPCPEAHSAGDDAYGSKPSEGVLSLTDGSEHAYQVHRNGFRGALFVKQQRWQGDTLTTVVGCACGALWRLGTLADAEALIVALRSMGDHEADELNRYGSPARGKFYHAIADRIAAGYVREPEPASPVAS